jgi:SNF2 family DNA or RNA helicase
VIDFEKLETGRPQAPVPGAPVIDKVSRAFGLVENTQVIQGLIRVFVIWNAGKAPSWVALDTLTSALQLGDEVSETPLLNTRESLGVGTVTARRILGGCEQFLVEFWHNADRLWLPWQNLRYFVGASRRFRERRLSPADNVERFRLRNLSHALEQWNLSTGALETLDIDPLPHQLYLVNHILSSGNLNWMIADDVGLGKTIEVGLLISALRRRNLRRFLLVVPAGLTQQWKEELRERFGLDDFRIYGRDVNPEYPSEWRGLDNVIASLDRLKTDKHLSNLINAEHWDMVVFDEAHRLTRSQYGEKLDASERFKLAMQLRARTDAMLLLTGTPHQGKNDLFAGLIELLRPNDRDIIRKLNLQPEFLREVIIRNRKADVTDLDGNFVFKGKRTQTLQFKYSEAESNFDAQLHNYLSAGYNISLGGGTFNRAVGFVMTVYRKLAASSIKAILGALERRLYTLIHQSEADQASEDEGDERFAGEVEEKEVQKTQRKEFFDGEIDRLRVILQCGNAIVHDSKMLGFLGSIVEQATLRNSAEKILIFTEYRTTQRYIEETLASRFGADKVQTIHGGKSVDERRQAMRIFEDTGQFLVSTEAGGEGLNLQRRCHIMVNYDLPWNPMRLVQRVGRLYRYGQQKTVLVINIHNPQSLDSKILAIIFDRLQVVAKTMIPIGDEYRAAQLEEDILGELSEALDIGEILDAAFQDGEQRTKQRIDEALKKAQSAATWQNDLFKHANHYDPKLSQDDLRLTSDHLKSFAEGMFAALGWEFEKIDKGRSWSLRLPSTLALRLNIKGKVRITTDREVKTQKPAAHLLDAQSPLLQYLFEAARSTDFGGLVAQITGMPGQAMVNALLRWQNERGILLRQEYVALCLDAAGDLQVNPAEWKQWLLEPRPSAAEPHLHSQMLMERALNAFDQRLGDLMRGELYPSGCWVFSAAWCDGLIEEFKNGKM